MDGLPELYRISFGNSIEYFTSWPESLTFGGQLYKAAPIKRSGFNLDSQYKNVTMTISAPPTEAFAQYLAGSPAGVTEIIIYRALETDLTDYKVLFSGNIKSISFKDHLCSAEVVSNSNILDNPIPPYLYQSYCNHTIFDAGCSLSASTWSQNLGGIVLGEDANGYYAEHAYFGTGFYSDGYFTQGVIASVDGEFVRLITYHDRANGKCYLHVPFGSDELESGDNAYAYPGCDGSPGVCDSKFSNLLHFLGMPYIPSNNPVIWGFCQPKPV